MENQHNKNPWLGLESYREGEVLYGRDDDIRNLSQCVINDRDTLLYGKSGIGKSSILNAGVIPAARRNGYTPVIIRLAHKDAHSYLQQIKDAIAASILSLSLDDSGNVPEIPENDNMDRALALSKCIKEVIPCKNADAECIYEYFHRHEFFNKRGERLKLLVIFDQFEEIFTLQNEEGKKKSFFAEMADFINDIVPNGLQSYTIEQAKEMVEVKNLDESSFLDILDDFNIEKSDKSTEYVTDNEIHLVFTIREDFLSEFEYYTATIPSLKQNRYGLRPINEEQASQIIMRPKPGLINTAVAQLIIEKVTGRCDFKLDGIPEIEVDSAVLSLYLNRLYEAKTGDTISAELVENKGGEIIADFYSDAISVLEPAKIDFLEDRLLNGQGRRDNITVYDAIHNGGFNENDLELLCNKKKILRLFNYGGDLRVEFVHDILCPVVKVHKDDRAMLQKQKEERRRQEEEKQRIVAEEKAKRAKLLEKAAIVKRRNRQRTIMFSTAIAALVIVGLLCYFWKFHIFSAEYSRYEVRNGEIAGVESTRLTSSECTHTPLYYKLKHKGWGTHVSEIEVCSSNKQLPVIPRVDVLEIGACDMGDVRGKEFDELLAKVKRIRISEDENLRIIKEEYLDEQNGILFELNYTYTGDKEASVHFLSGKGQNLVVRDSGVEQVRLSWNDAGRITGISYSDHSGVRKEIAKGVNGYLWQYDNATNIERKYILNEYFQPTLSSTSEYNTIYTHLSGDSTICLYSRSSEIDSLKLDVMPQPARGPLGYAMTINVAGKDFLYDSFDRHCSAILATKRDDNGNILEQVIESIDGKSVPQGYPAIYRYAYNENGIMVSKQLLSSDGKPFGNGSGNVYKWSWKYGSNSMLEERISSDGTIVYRKTLTENNGVKIEETRDITNKDVNYFKRIDSIRGNTTISTFYGERGRKINGTWSGKTKDPECLLSYHRLEETVDGNTTVEKYYMYDEENDSIMRLPFVTADNGELKSYYMKTTVCDNDGIIERYTICDANEKIRNSMMFFIQNRQQIGRAVCGIDGNPVRCPEWEVEGFCYYKIFINKNNDNEYANFMAVNEWNDKSILCCNGVYYETSYLDCKGLTLNNGYQITGKHSQMVLVEKSANISSLQLPFLHILDRRSPLYNKGLRDNDRIIVCGKWNTGMSSSTLSAEWKKIGKQSISVKVLRPQPGHTFATIEKVIEPGDGNDVLAEYHIIALTKNEKETINDYLK